MTTPQPNMFQDVLRTQLAFGMGGSGSRLLTNYIALNLYDKLVTSYSVWFPTVHGFCFRRQKTQPATALPPQNKEVRCTIECERNIPQTGSKQSGQTTHNINHVRMDAVISYITTLPVIRNLLCMSHHEYLPHEFEPIQLETDLYFQLLTLKHNDGQVETIRFKLFCYDHDMQYLQTFVDKCNHDYERRMANKLGTSLYFFDMMASTKGRNRTTQNPLPTTHLMYTKHKFYTTRTFDNVFFEQRQQVKNHVNFFLTRRDWYEAKGIPYTLGFLFHGSPGTGKTSSVKAIANTARRHIINVQLSEIKTKAQLRHLFFNEDINVYNGTTTERYTIPVHERLYVIEDIDAMGDTVLRREWKKPVSSVEEKPKKSGDPWLDNTEEDQKEPIDLSFLLNLLDGTLESSGRIIAISSNFPERIDRALIRPGRIDMIIHFKKCNTAILHEMVDSFYDKSITGLQCEDYKWSPAEVNQILFRNFEKPENAVRELNELQPKDLYGFDLVEDTPLSYEEFAKE
jgi:hypothetical protein